MTSVIDDALKFIKRKLYFLADYLHSCICQSAECERPDQGRKDIKLNESDHGSQADDLTCNVTFTNRDWGASGNKVQVHNQIMPRSRFDQFSSSGFKQSHGIKNRQRDRAVSRIPLNKLNRALQKSKTARCLLRKHFQNTVPKSSSLHKYVNRTSDMYYRLISENYQTKNVAQNSSRHWLYLAFIKLRSAKHKKDAPFFIYTHSTGLTKLKDSHMQTLWVSNCIITLSGDVEENPGPLDNMTAVSSLRSDRVSLLEYRLSQMGRTSLDVGGDGDCFFRSVSHQLYGTPSNRFYVGSVGMQHLVSNPELFIESNTERSWMDYLTNMSRQGTWADGIMIQAVANSINITINIAESNETFSPPTVIRPANAVGNSENIYIGHIGESHYVSIYVYIKLQPK